MPDDHHIDGFRADVLALLRGLKAPVYRWPGGNFVSGYDWHDGIGERDKRPPGEIRPGQEWNRTMSGSMSLCDCVNCWIPSLILL